jgi:hypothetical protein
MSRNEISKDDFRSIIEGTLGIFLDNCLIFVSRNFDAEAKEENKKVLSVAENL